VSLVVSGFSRTQDAVPGFSRASWLVWHIEGGKPGSVMKTIDIAAVGVYKTRSQGQYVGARVATGDR
jgi:hypothetical protein